MGWLDLFVPLLGRWSEGWRLTHAYGPASPEAIEHALKNEPVARGPCGRWLDSWFLRQPHWNALRTLHAQVAERLEGFLRRREHYGLDTFVLDLGAGSAQYAWKLIERGRQLSVLCLRRQPNEVALCRTVVAPPLRTQIDIQIGDRLDPASFLTAREPDVVVFLGPATSFADAHNLETFFSLTLRCLNAGGLFLFGVVLPPLRARAPQPPSFDQCADKLRGVGFDQVAAIQHWVRGFLVESRKSWTWGSQ